MQNICLPYKDFNNQNLQSLLFLGSFSRLDNLSFALFLGSTCCWWHGIFQQFGFLLVNNFLSSPSFSKLFTACSGLVLAVPTIIVVWCCRIPCMSYQKHWGSLGTSFRRKSVKLLQTGLFDIQLSLFCRIYQFYYQ